MTTADDSDTPAYAQRYRDHVVMSRHDGVLEIRMHTDDGPALFSVGLKHALGAMWSEVGDDPDNEVVIVTGTGDRWIAGLDPESLAAMNQVASAAPDQAHQLVYADGVGMIRHLVFDVQVPTIGVINGPGPRKETALLCDITLCADDAPISDGNLALGHAPPGDGMHLVLQEVLGPKRAAYRLLTGTPIDPDEALALGLVDEVLPRAELMPRARAIASDLLRSSSTTRRLAHTITQRPWRLRLANDLEFGLAHISYAARLGLGQHDDPRRS